MTIALAVLGEGTTQLGLKRIKDDIVLPLSQTMDDVGHQIKIEESFGSEMYFAFSKYASYQDVELPQGLRKYYRIEESQSDRKPTQDII